MIRAIRISLIATVLSVAGLAAGQAFSASASCDCSPCSCGENCSCAGCQH